MGFFQSYGVDETLYIFSDLSANIKLMLRKLL